MAYIQKRATKAGETTYRAMVRLAGYPPRSACFGKQSEAKAWASQIEAEMRSGRYRYNLAAQKRTVREMIDKFLELDAKKPAKNLKKRYKNNKRAQLIWWKDVTGSLAIAHLTGMVIAEKRDLLISKGLSGSTVNRYLAALSHVIGVAMREWGWFDTNPMITVEKPEEKRGRTRHLIGNELETLLDACRVVKKKPLFLIVILAICTGARKNEILTLKRADLDLDRQVAVVYDTKNGEPHQLYLADYVTALLTEWMATLPARADFVFPSRTGKTPMNIEMEWIGARERAKLKDFRFHDLRHTHASYLASLKNATPMIIAESLNQRGLANVQRYTHLTTSHIAAIVRGMGDQLFPPNQQRVSA